jgi:ATP-dependent Clp protease adaptor protein ClpS
LATLTPQPLLDILIRWEPPCRASPNRVQSTPPSGSKRAPTQGIGWQEEEVSTSRPRFSGQVAPEEVEDRTTGGGEGSKVFLFNCECHTFEEVITQLLKAVPGMTRPLAEELAWRVHTTGLAEVYRGGASDCDRVAKILGETGLIVQVL